MKGKPLHWLAPTSLLAWMLLAGCNTTPELRNRPGFLSSYDHLRQVDDLTWRYVNPVLLGQCKKLIIPEVQILSSEFQGKPVTEEDRRRSAKFVRDAMILALADRYTVVTERAPDVCELRIAVTDAYGKGGKLGLSVEGEILDHSRTQVTAVMRTEMSERYVADWEDRPTARKMVEAWARRVRKTMDDAHAANRAVSN